MCSTFKLALIAAYLREADHGRIDLDEIVAYSEADLLPWAPVTRKNLAKGGLSIAALAQAAQEMSDGAAANLLVRRLGGPAAVTAKVREMGDTVTRLDRYEPDLGLVLSADLRDTTSPSAMAQLVRRITTGDILQHSSQERLLQWMQNTNTGPNRLRAGLPAEWRTAIKQLAGAIKARWVCEQAHQQLKEELGLDHFEGRSWKGLHRHALMSMIALAFLQSLRLKQGKGGKKNLRPSTETEPASNQTSHH